MKPLNLPRDRYLDAGVRPVGRKEEARFVECEGNEVAAMSLLEDWIDRDITKIFRSATSLPIGKPVSPDDKKLFGGLEFLFAQGYWANRPAGKTREFTIKINPDCDKRDAHQSVVELQRLSDEYPIGIGSIRGLVVQLGERQCSQANREVARQNENKQDVIAAADWRRGIITLYNENTTGRLYGAAIELAPSGSEETKADTTLRQFILRELTHLYLRVPRAQSHVRTLAESVAKAEQSGKLMSAAKNLNPSYLPKVIHTWRAQRPDLLKQEKTAIDRWVAREFATELLNTVKWAGGRRPKLPWKELAEFAKILDTEDLERPRYSRSSTPKIPDHVVRSGLPMLGNDLVVTIGGH